MSHVSIQSPFIYNDLWCLTLPSERLSILEMTNSNFSLLARRNDYVYLHQFPLTSSSSASSNWFWYVTTRLDSLLTKDLAESLEHHRQQNLVWFLFFFHFVFKRGSLQINTGNSDSIKHIMLDAQQQKVIQRISHPLSHLSLGSKRVSSHHVATQCTHAKAKSLVYLHNSANLAASLDT